MRLSNPIEHLAASLHHAALSALPPLEYTTRDFAALYSLPPAEQKAIRAGEKPYPETPVCRQPTPDECVVLAMFSQTWSSTALGFGGVGGAAMTPAYTVVIEGPGGECAVYWSGRHAYTVRPREASTEQLQAWLEDLGNHTTTGCADAGARYGVAPRANPGAA